MVFNKHYAAEAPIEHPGYHSLNHFPDVFLLISDTFPVHHKDSSQEAAAAISDLRVIQGICCIYKLTTEGSPILKFGEG